jgi:hypothetical protein
MKTPTEWIRDIANDRTGCDQSPACICDRCKNGRETFLLARDIVDIQAEALRHAAELVHSMSRGTRSEDRAVEIDEARDLILGECLTWERALRRAHSEKENEP